MLQKILALAFSFLLFPNVTQAASADGDVCAIRPDLCDSTDAAPAPVKRTHRLKPVVTKSTMATTRTIEARPVVPVEAMSAVQVKPVARRPLAKISIATKAAAKCRVAGQPYNLDNADLPVCTNEASADPVPAPTRAPASETRRVDFDAYMNANSTHPAMVHHSGSQQAFQDSARPVSFNLPSVSVDGSSVREGGAGSAPAPASQQSASNQGIGH